MKYYKKFMKITKFMKNTNYYFSMSRSFLSLEVKVTDINYHKLA